jgi:hypothetical protein
MIIKTLSVVAVVTAALASPVFAQDEAAAPQKPTHALRHYRGTYNQVDVNGPAYVAPRAAGGTYFDGESFDRSRIGEHDADFSPSGS